MGNRRGGTLFLKINGESFSAKGNFEFGGGKEKAGIAGADGIHGFKETWTVYYISGAITDRGDLDLEKVWDLDNATVTLELGSGKTIILSNAWFEGARKATTEEGEVEVRFAGRLLTMSEATAERDHAPRGARRNRRSRGPCMEPAASAPPSGGEGQTVAERAADHARRRVSFALKLEVPKEFGNQRVTELIFQPLTGRSIRSIPIDKATLTMGHFMDIASQCTGLPPAFFNSMAADDVTAAIEVVGAFLQASQKTGASA